jgi:hypothetical protein
MLEDSDWVAAPLPSHAENYINPGNSSLGLANRIWKLEKRETEKL